MKFSATILALAFGSASAFMARPAASRSALKMTTQDELIELAESNRDSLGAGLGFWDPLGCSSMSFWTLSNEETNGYLPWILRSIPRRCQGIAQFPPIPWLRRERF